MRPRNRKLYFLLLAILFCAAPFGSALADGPLRSIVVFGNQKTERKTILNIIGIEPRTYVDRNLVREIRDRLISCGLFKTVRVSSQNNKNGTADLRVVVSEKQLWFLFPTFTAWSGRYNGGLVFGESNFFMSNARTAILAGYGNESSRALIAWDIKNLWGSNFTLRNYVHGKSDNTPIFSDKTQISEVNLRELSYGLRPGYQWTNEIITSVQVKYKYVEYGDSPLVLESGQKGHDISVEFAFTFDSLKRKEAFLEGSLLKVEYEFSDNRFGSDFSYNIEKVIGRYATPVLKYFNYVLSAEGTIGDRLPFHRELTLGADSLRGYADRQFRGDTRLSMKQDLLFKLFRHSKFSVFGVAFYDLGLIYRDVDGLGRGNFRNGTGGGIRVSLSGIVAPVFGLDVAYGLEDKAMRIYFALGLVQF